MNRLAVVLVRRVWLVLIFLLSLDQAVAQTRWQRFTAPDGAFTVSFPASPQHFRVPNEQEGSPIEGYSVITGKYSYGVVYQDAPRPVDETSRSSMKALADGCKLSAQSSPGRRLLRVRELPGGIVECLSSGPSGNDVHPTDRRLERNFVRGRRYYTLSVISWAPGGIDGASALRFFSSFKLLPIQSSAPIGDGRVPQELPQFSLSLSTR